ncbi:MAG: TPM domain-containing protein [Methylocystis sp.]
MKLNQVFNIASAVVALCLFASVALAAFSFPQLTGRVTDQANIISAPAKASIEAKLQNLEDKSSIQLVVATVNSLEGGDIESYANGLFRAWKLGMAKKNNGVLFLIAPNERKMRIEVGYGLEGVLTDAVSSVIIRSAVAPRFKAGDFSGGIERGVDAIIDVLSSDTSEWTKRAAEQSMSETIDQLTPIILFILFVFIMIYMSRNARGGGGGPMIFLPPGGGFGGGGGGFGGGSFGGGGGGGGGFSGGGGSSGGGGASGDW